MPRLLRSAFVIGRRDFTATVFSRAFLFFLLGPLFPVLMGAIFGGIGGSVVSRAERPVVAVVGQPQDYARLLVARNRLDEAIEALPLVELRYYPPETDAATQRTRLLQSQDPPVIAVLEGGLASPRLTGDLKPDSNTARQIELMIEQARLESLAAPAPDATVQLVKTERAPGSLAPQRALTARAGQALLFLLTLLLSTMLLSQLIDEKSNKIIEVLAAAAPVEAIFLGKLFAMLLISLLGICVWTAVGALAIAAIAAGGLSVLAPPALGWPAFLGLAVIYFSMSYLLLGAVFLGIGAQASTAREVQTLSMPVTMAQVLIFALAATAVGDPDSPVAIFAAIFPLSSPFVLLAWAAEYEAAWPHLLGILWQSAWVLLILRVGARIFRRSVLKSGPVKRRRRKMRKAVDSAVGMPLS